MNKEQLLAQKEPRWDTTLSDEIPPVDNQQFNTNPDEMETKDLESNIQLQNEGKQTVELNQFNKRKSSDGERGEFFNSKKPFFSLEIAQKHALANRVYREEIDQCSTSETLRSNPLDICPCCQNIVQPDSNMIDVFKSTFKEIAHLGPTYPMYFQFLRYSMAFIAIILLLSGIYNLVSNKNGSYCSELAEEYKDQPERACNESFMTIYAGSNRGGSAKPDSTGSILNLVTSILLMIFSTGFRFRQIQFEREIDKSDISVSDYTIFINKIPTNKTRQDIVEFLQAQVPEIKIEKIVQGFKLKEYNTLNQQFLSAKTSSLREEIRSKIEAYEKKCYYQEDLSETFCGAAFVSFEKEEQAVKVVEHFSYTPWKQFLKLEKEDPNKFFDGSQIYIIQAKEPGDTNWENLEYTTKEKYTRRTITVGLTLILLGLSFVAIFLVGDEQGNIRKTEKDQYKLMGLSALASIITVIINYILQYCMQLFAEYEVYNFKTDTVISIAKKSGIAQFINTTLVSFFVSLILNGMYIWINGGLVNSITVLVFSNCFAPAAISLLSAENITKWVYQQMFLRSSEEEKKKYTQLQVNTLFELPIFNPAACFALAANSLLFAAFYSWIVPIALPFCILSLALQYYVNKYKLLRKQSMPIPLGTDLPEEMIDFYFEIIILFYSLGCLSFEVILYDTAHICTILMVIFSAAFYILPINEYLDEKFNSESNYIESLTYREAKTQGHFQTDYDRKNPILMAKTLQKDINRLIDSEQDPVKKEQLRSVFYISSSKLQCNFVNQSDMVISKSVSQNFEQSVIQRNTQRDTSDGDNN